MTKSRKRDNGVIEGQFTEPVASEPIRGDADRDRVAQRAYELYMARGGEHGQDMEDWLAAELEVSGRESRPGTER
jgi:Protein of unknown function (DUF2934)